MSPLVELPGRDHLGVDAGARAVHPADRLQNLGARFKRRLGVADHDTALAALDDPQLDGPNAQCAAEPLVLWKRLVVLQVEQQVRSQPLDRHSLADGFAQRGERPGGDHVHGGGIEVRRAVLALQ